MRGKRQSGQFLSTSVGFRCLLKLCPARPTWWCSSTGSSGTESETIFQTCGAVSVSTKWSDWCAAVSTDLSSKSTTHLIDCQLATIVVMWTLLQFRLQIWHPMCAFLHLLQLWQWRQCAATFSWFWRCLPVRTVPLSKSHSLKILCVCTLNEPRLMSCFQTFCTSFQPTWCNIMCCALMRRSFCVVASDHLHLSTNDATIAKGWLLSLDNDVSENFHRRFVRDARGDPQCFCPRNDFWHRQKKIQPWLCWRSTPNWNCAKSFWAMSMHTMNFSVTKPVLLAFCPFEISHQTSTTHHRVAAHRN